jgi:hypothetical protein
MNKILVSLALICSINCLAEDYSALIKQVKAGKISKAMAHWWGYNKSDSTNALQTAINSGAKTVHIKKMSSPWIIRPVKLKSNQQIIIDKGVEIIAKKGAFKSILACLFKAENCRNLEIVSDGARLIMHKKDYHNRKFYRKSEWRHAISLLSCQNVLIKGISIEDSGGDGIYVGVLPGAKNYCRNIKIENVICKGNNRQGISVISAENLLVKDSKLLNTDGTAPMAGIDFEPNHPNQRLVNCIVDNCIINGNVSSGVTSYIKLNKYAPKVSITVKDCQIGGSINAVQFVEPSGLFQVKNPVQGKIKFVNCHIKDYTNAGIELRNVRDDSYQVLFEKCKITNSRSNATPLIFATTPGFNQPTGKVNFDDCNIELKDNKQWFVFRSNYASNVLMRDVVGTVSVNTKNINVAEYVKNKGWNKIQKSETRKVYLKSLFPVKGYKTVKANAGTRKIIFRSQITFLLAVEKNNTASFKLDYRQISRRYKDKPITVELTTPDGKKISLSHALCNRLNEYSFTAKVTGVYGVTCNPRGNTLSISECTVPCSFKLPEKGYLQLIKPAAKLYFCIPADVAGFKIIVAGQDIETVDAKIKIGTKVMASATKISLPRELNVKVKPSASIRYGCIELTNAVEDVMLKIPGPLMPIVATDTSELVTSIEQKSL